ncbi:Fc fragment of IgM receptor [Rhinolophus ferrumequinum]|uniref:Fc mu receptor n=1 Tax=Rhinolophus ferrumequinum TaxID=59479 RepID=A0A671FVL6_RHIFE|nr:fas apoptotic inhibitory molecule 3 isoform X2 [Rhinolophus ferrumequinum]KAF6292838.1 Fc fragment of IgM receptor [Rhinolophus ferrumequinum]
MDIWLWSLYFLPVSGALKILPEVKLEGMLGGSITIKCPLPETPRRLYLCREIDKPRSCVTVISNTNFVRMDYKDRVTLKPCPDQNLFLVEVKELTKSDSGVYACGAGRNTGWGKTQQVTLNVHSEYEPFWEEEPVPEPPAWFQKFLHRPMPWFQMPAHASSFEFISKVSTPAQKTAVPSAHHSSPTTPITHRPRVSRSSPVVSAKPTTLLPSTTTSKTSAPEEPLRPQTASYNHQTKPYRQRAFNHVPASRMEDQGFHILIPTILGLILLALLGLVAKRVIQRRKALSRQVRRLAVRMSALEASQRPPSQRPRVSQRSRSQNNVYSACPRRSGWAQAAGEGEAPVPSSEASAPPAPPQVSEAPWPHALSLKTSCEYMSFYHKPVANMEDTDSDYVNIPCPTHPSNCLPGPRPWCQ